MTNTTNQNEQWKLLVLLLKEIAESKGITQAEQFEKETIPQMSMTEKVKQGWKVFKSY